MPTHRMASGPLLLSAILASSFILGSAGQQIKLASDVTDFIPSCAQSCFQRQVEANFDSKACGSSLSCLCSQTGKDGYTLGEAALVCLSIETSNQACTSDNTKSDTIPKAYGMCAGQPNAAAITHSSIVATVPVSSSSSQVKPTVPILAPAPTITSGKTTLTQSTLVVDTNTASKPTASATGAPSASTEAAPQQLETIQIIGIAVGVGGGILLAIGVFLLFWCLRRRKAERERLDGHSSKFRDSWSIGGKSAQASPYMLQISKPVLVERQQPDFARAMGHPADVRPEAIGVAMCPPTSSPATARQGTPRLPANSDQVDFAPAVPAKPRLTLHIPKEGAIPPPPPLKHAPPMKKPPTVPTALPTMPFSSGRDSVVTEFAEDGEGTLSAGGAQIWRQPKSADPQSSTTYYVADKVGNWVLGNNLQQSNAIELEGSSPMVAAVPEPLRIQPRSHAMTTSLAVPAQPPARMAIPGTQTSQLQAPKPRATSSVYSTTNFSKPVSSYPVPPIPSIEVSSDSARNSRARSLTKGIGRSDTVVSGHSVTTIASSTASGEIGDIIDPVGPIQKGLSPVAESPKSPAGHLRSPSEGISPVTYPKIPGRHDPKLQVFPFPSQVNQVQQPGQRAPGFLVPASVGGTITSNSRPGRPLLNPNPNRNPAQIRTGSPNVPQGQLSQQPQQPPRHASPRLQQSQQLQQQQPRRASPRIQQSPRMQQQPQQPRHASPRPQQPVNATAVPMSANFASAPTSSLASKRLGADRAAGLALQTSQQAGGSGIGGSKIQGKWHRNSNSAQQMAPGVNVDGVGHVPLPSTPGWEPKLTPKKMGDDLFLSVG